MHIDNTQRRMFFGIKAKFPPENCIMTDHMVKATFKITMYYTADLLTQGLLAFVVPPLRYHPLLSSSPSGTPFLVTGRGGRDH